MRESSGAGWKLPSQLKEWGVTRFIAGEMGKNLISELKSLNIEYEKGNF